MSLNINGMSRKEAARYYASKGIVTHPLKGSQDKCTSPGKQPVLLDWSRIEIPPTEGEIDRIFNDDMNIGYICGARSNLTVLDFDWIRKGIWEYIFRNVDVSQFIKTSHTVGKCHFLFQYCEKLNAGQYKVLGFDILSDKKVKKDGVTYIAGDNCVCAPSIHIDGNKYQIAGNIEDRIKIPDGIIARLDDLITRYDELKKIILPKCRPWFRNLWKSLFESTKDDLYHQTDIFYGDMESRTRFLHFCAELKANGADDDHLQIICMVIFGDQYSAELTKKELVHIKSLPATAESILADPYFMRFYSDSYRSKSPANEAPSLNEDSRKHTKNTVENKPSQDEEHENKESKLEDHVNRYPQHIQNYAYKLLREGDPFVFMMETWSLRHVGDRNIGENCLCAAASTHILNSNGIHDKPSGDSGKGKSDGMETALLLLPPRKYIKGSLSAKNLFYDDSLPDGLIVYSDDVHLGEEMISTVKQSTSSFQERKQHRTLIKQKPVNLYLPARISWWFSSVDGFSDEQLANRFVNCDVDGSREQDIRVVTHIKHAEELDLMPDDEDLLICRCVFDILDKEKYIIKVPYVKAIDWRNPENRRNFKKFLDIIRSVAFFKVFQREKVKGCYLAEYEDYERAREIYKGTAKHNATNLTDRELQVLQFIVEKNNYDCNGDLILEKEVETQEIMKKFELSQSRVHQILHGKDGKGGMLAKIPNLSKIPKSVSTGDNYEKTTRNRNAYVYRGKMLGFEIYDSVVTLDREAAIQATENFIKSIMRDTITYIAPLLPSDNPIEVIDKSSIENRINHNIKSNSNNDREKVRITSLITAYNNRLSAESPGDEGYSCQEGNRSIDYSKKPKHNDSSIASQGNRKVIDGNRGDSTVIDGVNSDSSIYDMRAEIIEQIHRQMFPDISHCEFRSEQEKKNFVRSLESTLETRVVSFQKRKKIVEKIVPIKHSAKMNNVDLNIAFVNALEANSDNEIYRKIMSGEKIEVRKDIMLFWELFHGTDGIKTSDIEEIALAQEARELYKEIPSKEDTKYKNNCYCTEGNRAIDNQSMPTDDELSITSQGNRKVTEDNRGNNDIIDGFENIKKLKFLRKDLETQHRTYIRKNGGIENIGEFVEEFLKENPRYRNSWSFDIIISEAEKLCRKPPSESKKTTIVM